MSLNIDNQRTEKRQVHKILDEVNMCIWIYS